VFVVGIGQANDLATRIGRRTCVLSSQSKVVDESAEIFIATSVADVGITIPDVDWVITSSVTKTAKLDNGNNLPILVSLDPSAVQQRKGRTGRTSNGLFTLMRYPKIEHQFELPVWDDTSIGVSLLKGGTPVEFIARFFPSSITYLWSSPYDRNEDSRIDTFVQHMSTFQKTFDSSSQRSFVPNLDDDSNDANFWTIQGNTIPTKELLPNVKIGERALKSASVTNVIDFITGASLWLLKNDKGITETEVEAYMRLNEISAKSFIDVFEEDEGFDRDMYLDTSSLQHPSGRFGRRALANTTAHVEVFKQGITPMFEGFSTYSNPAPSWDAIP
jgi:hypothetical protein